MTERYSDRESREREIDEAALKCLAAREWN